MIKVKFSDINTLALSQAAIKAQADYIGITFLPHNSQAIDGATAHQIADTLRPLRRGHRPQLVAHIADRPIKAVHNLYNGPISADAVELCGKETLDYCRQAITATGAALFKALSVPFTGELDHLKAQMTEYQAAGCQISLHCPPERWHEVGFLTDDGFQFMLTDGLSSDSISWALREVDPWGVATDCGPDIYQIKTLHEMQQFINKVRAFSTRYDLE